MTPVTLTLSDACTLFADDLIEVMDAMASNLRDDIQAHEAESAEVCALLATPLERSIATDVERIRFADLFADRIKHVERVARIIEERSVRHPMRSRITDAMVARAKEYPLEELYAQHATGKLRKNGSRMYVGTCPFHSERTGSFYIYKSDNHAYCYGCTWGGDAIAFYMKANGLEPRDFPKAVRALQ